MYIFRLLIIMIFASWVQGCNTPAGEVGQNPYEDGYSKMATLKNRLSWNGANVHDPSCIKVGDTYYLYSTDAYYIPPNVNFKDDPSVEMGKVPVRSSKDLVHWKFEGWAFDSIPYKAYGHVKEANEGKAPSGIWAPYVCKEKDEFRMYYSVSSYGTNASCIGLATSASPLGPWKDKGIVVKTTYDSKKNAVDPSVVSDKQTGRHWMIYGSYYGGIYCVELDPKTGKTLKEEDLGKNVAQRANGRNKVIEAPEIVYNKEQDMYYLFVSYDPLFTFLNLRVGRSKSPEGPFLDYFGDDLKDTTNNYPILTHSYMFNNHPGWSGNGHCGIVKDGDKYFAMHQGRLAPDNVMMQLHVRKIKWLKNGWPVLSPERYSQIEDTGKYAQEEISGTWEIIELNEIPEPGELWQGQIPAGGWKYSTKAFNLSFLMQINEGRVTKAGDTDFNSYQITDGSIEFTDLKGQHFECKLFRGWDWENKNETILFSGILPNGHGIWGKKIAM